MTDFTPQLLHARTLLVELLEHIRSFPTDLLMYHAPIVDRIRFAPWRQDEVMGLKKFADGVEHHLKQMETLVNSGVPTRDDPLPSVLGLISFWKIIITSPPPIVGVRMSMTPNPLPNPKSRPLCDSVDEGSYLGKTRKVNGHSLGHQKGQGKGKGKEKEVWVDVIAQGGREWVRIYSKKISHLLAEFREADSYVNSDYDSDSSASACTHPDLDSSRTGHQHSRSNGTSAADNTASSSKSGPGPGMTNSLVLTAQELQLAASSVDRIPGAPAPSLVIHLTRLPSRPSELDYGDFESDEGGWPDSRIPETFELIQKMGIKLSFGDLSDRPLSSLCGYPIPHEKGLSTRFNLDITTLMGLCSDVLHYPLPQSKEEAKRRSLRPSTHLLPSANTAARGRDGTGKGSKKSRKEDEDEDDEDLKGQSQNSRELYRCILEEMRRPFLEEFERVVQDAWRERDERMGARRSRSCAKGSNGSNGSHGVREEDHPSDAGTAGPVEELENDMKRTMDNLNLNLDHDLGKIPSGSVEFWTTPQAARYTYEALSSGPAHGNGWEQRRMLRMLGYERGDFFEGSRYQGKEGVFKGFRLRIIGENDDHDDDKDSRATSASVDGNGDGDRTGFHQTLEAITQTFLDDYYASLPDPSGSAAAYPSPPSSSPPETPNSGTSTRSSSTKPSSERHRSGASANAKPDLPSFLQPKKMPTPPVAKISLPFPVVSLHSLHEGARRGMTTVMMGTATLKEVWTQSRWRTRGWERGYYARSLGGTNGTGNAGHVCLGGGGSGPDDHGETEIQGSREREGKKRGQEAFASAAAAVGAGAGATGTAAVIIFPYRVFGEGKRVRFEQGDWSYPAREEGA